MTDDIVNDRFGVKTFMKSVHDRLSQSKENLEYLVDAYNWWQWPDNDREMRKAYPQARREWLRQEIMRIFNVDPQIVTRIVSRLSGSKRAEDRKKGWRFAKRIGTWELYHADRVLKPEQMKELSKKFPSGDSPITPEQIRTVVDEMAQILKSRQQLDVGDRIDYRREYLTLLQENAALKKEVQMLRDMVKKLDRKGAKTRT